MGKFYSQIKTEKKKKKSLSTGLSTLQKREFPLLSLPYSMYVKTYCAVQAYYLNDSVGCFRWDMSKYTKHFSKAC